MYSIVKTSLQFRFLVLVIAGVLILSGIGELRTMSVDVLPEFSLPFVEIQTEALGLSAEEVEQMITVPIEQDLLAGVAWLDIIRSESVPGLSSVLIYFEPGTDLYSARQMVSERLAQAAVGIPHVSKPPAMIQPTSSASRFMIVGLSSDKLSLIDLGVLARWTIAPRLLGVPGVANIAIWGNRERQLQVLVDPERLDAQGVSLGQIIETTGNALWVSSLSFLEASSPGTGGFIDTPNQRLGIWHVLPISSPADLEKVPVEGTSLILSDVATVVEDHQPLIGDAIVKENANLLLVIEKLPGTNTLEVTRGVESALAALKPGFTEIEFDATLFKPATFLEAAIANLGKSLIVGALLAIVALSALFYGWRKALISFIAIPVSLLTVLLVLNMQGLSLNAMVLAGMTVALGLIIDEAVTDVDNIARRLQSKSVSQSFEGKILEAAAEMRGALFFAVLLTLLAVMPVFFISGTAGALLQPLAYTYALSVIAGMAVALTVTPALSMLLMSNEQTENKTAPIIAALQRSYEGALARTFQKPGLAYAVTALIVVAGLALTPTLLQANLLPGFRETNLVVKLEGAPATSRLEMNRIVSRMSGELRGLSGVSNVGAHVGRAVLGDQVVGINSAEIWISVAPNADYDATIAAIKEVANGYPGLKREVLTHVQETLRPLKIATSDPYTLRVYGEDYATLVAEAGKMQKTLAGIDGVINAHAIFPIEEPTLEIQVDLAKAQEHSVRPGDVRRAAATLISGLSVGSLFEEQKVFDVVVWGAPATRQSLGTIGNLLIDTPGGERVRLGEVADVRIVAAPTVIQREGNSPYIDIGFDISGNSTAVLAKIHNMVSNYPFPLEFHAEIVDDYATQQAARQNILISTALAVVGIFLLLQAATRSWTLALTTLITFPVALAGGVLASALLPGSVSHAALFGLLAVLGISARNSILMIRRYQSLEAEGEAFGPGLIVHGSLERLAPLATTTLTTALALLPFVLFGNVAGQEVARPMAVIVIGGLVTSTWLNLLITPALYLRLGANREAELELQPIAAASEA